MTEAAASRDESEALLRVRGDGDREPTGVGGSRDTAASRGWTRGGALAALVCVALAMFAMFAVGGDVVRSANASDGDLDLALGALECDSAFTVPSSERGVDRHSYTFTKLVSMADFIYILCVGCESIRVPSAWRGKVLLVDGKVIDECMQDYALDHWHRATFSHAIAVAHARSKGYEVAAVVEDDARSDFTLTIHGPGLRFVQRDASDPRTVDLHPAGIQAVRAGAKRQPGVLDRCQCEKVDERTCVIVAPGCDLRSSDAYFVHRGAYNDYIHRLQQGVVDFDVLQSFPKMLLMSPMISYQEKLDITMDAQRDLQGLFKEKCMRSEGAWTAREVAREGGRREHHARIVGGEERRGGWGETKRASPQTPNGGAPVGALGRHHAHHVSRRANAANVHFALSRARR